MLLLPTNSRLFAEFFLTLHTRKHTHTRTRKHLREMQDNSLLSEMTTLCLTTRDKYGDTSPSNSLSNRDLVRQVEALHKLKLLRPYERDVLCNCILRELEAKVDDSFTLADLMAFASNAGQYVVSKYGVHGMALFGPTGPWKPEIQFHKDLALCWDELTPSSQFELQNGIPIQQVLIAAEQLLMKENAKKCLVPAKFQFEDV